MEENEKAELTTIQSAAADLLLMIDARLKCDGFGRADAREVLNSIAKGCLWRTDALTAEIAPAAPEAGEAQHSGGL